MTLYICYYKNEDWCCYVAAPTRGKVKHLFNEWYGDGLYTDVRTQKVKDCPDTPEGVYDEDCPELEKLGVRYLTEEENGRRIMILYGKPALGHTADL